MHPTNRLSQIQLYHESKKLRDTLICRICQKLFSGKSRRKEIDQHIKKHFRKRIGNKVSSDLKQALNEELYGKKEHKFSKIRPDHTEAYNTEVNDESINELQIQHDQVEYKNQEHHVIKDYCRMCTLQYSRERLQVFTSLYDLTNHVINKHRDFSSLFHCPDCSMGFSHEISLSLHQHFSHGEGQYGVPYPGPIT